MKKLFLIGCVALFGFAVTSCGNNGSHSGRPDTVSNRYGAANDTKGSAEKTLDTGKVVSKDYSASGGTVRDTDTTKRKDSVKKR